MKKLFQMPSREFQNASRNRKTIKGDGISEAEIMKKLMSDVLHVCIPSYYGISNLNGLDLSIRNKKLKYKIEMKPLGPDKI